MNGFLIAFALSTSVMADTTPLVSGDEVCNSILALKRSYLRCEESAQSGGLATNGIAYCSMVYYDLKDLAFEGSFEKIRTWYEISTSIQAPDSGTAVRRMNLQQNCG
jgi:hypothetical protein